MKRHQLIAPLLSLTLSYQAMANTTPIEDKRNQASEQAVRDLKQAMTFFTFPASRASVGMATGGSGGFINLSGLGWLMLPGALILDTLAVPFTALATPVLVGNIAYTNIKNRLAARGDQAKLTAELELFRESMHKRSEQAEKLIGNRLIQSEDLLAFTLGFTAIHSYMNNSHDGLTLINGQVITEQDIDVFPKTAQDVYRYMNHAKQDIRFLPANIQNEESFMKALVERMTFADENDRNSARIAMQDRLDDVILQLRSASKSIQETLQAL